jgi:hypothetical protein
MGEESPFAQWQARARARSAEMGGYGDHTDDVGDFLTVARRCWRTTR